MPHLRVTISQILPRVLKLRHVSAFCHDFPNFATRSQASSCFRDFSALATRSQASARFLKFHHAFKFLRFFSLCHAFSSFGTILRFASLRHAFSSSVAISQVSPRVLMLRHDSRSSSSFCDFQPLPRVLKLWHDSAIHQLMHSQVPSRFLKFSHAFSSFVTTLQLRQLSAILIHCHAFSSSTLSQVFVNSSTLVTLQSASSSKQ